MEIREGYKKTDIGVIPQEWDIMNIESICILSKRKYNPIISKDNFKCIELEHISQRTGRLLGYVESINQLSHKNYFSRGNILLGKLRPYLRKYLYANFDGVCSTEIWVLISNSKVYSRFLYYLIQTETVIEACNKSVGTKMPRAEWSNVKNVLLPIPPLFEQQTIATILDDNDALTNSLTKLINKKRNIKEGMMQELYSGKKRLKGFSGDWVESTLKKCAKIIRGASPRPIEDPKWFDSRSKVGWVRISDVSNSNKYLFNTTQYLSQLGIQNSRLVKKDNLIMSICATLGRPIITKIDVCIHDGFVLFDELQIDKEFLYYFLELYEKEWSKLGQIGSQKNLNTELINNTPIMLPPTIEEQIAIATVLSEIDNEVEKLERKLDKYKDIKKGLMQELLTGRIRLVGITASNQETKLTAIKKPKQNRHTKEFDEAVVISAIVSRFANEQFPMGPFRRQKFAYLLHRHLKNKAEGYEKFAAGPYNPHTKYGGAEKIALSSNYVKEYTRDNLKGFLPAEKSQQALEYFHKWYGNEALDWLEIFRYEKNDELELLTTVDMAMVDLMLDKKPISVTNVKSIIEESAEWKAKLKRDIFSDVNIKRAIERCNQLFGK